MKPLHLAGDIRYRLNGSGPFQRNLFIEFVFAYNKWQICVFTSLQKCACLFPDVISYKFRKFINWYSCKILALTKALLGGLL